MPDPLFVDTLFVIALINPRDAYHAQARELSHRLEDHLLLTTDAVLLEIGNALARGFKSQAVTVIDHILQAPEVEVVRLDLGLFERAYRLFSSYHDKEWGLVDCISFVVMRERGISCALTFDQHFVQAGYQALMRS